MFKTIDTISTTFFLLSDSYYIMLHVYAVIEWLDVGLIGQVEMEVCFCPMPSCLNIHSFSKLNDKCLCAQAPMYVILCIIHHIEVGGLFRYLSNYLRFGR